MRLLRLFSRDSRGAAGAEMALVAPVLIILMFGAFDTGNYFLTQHIITVGVRDGVRYAGRQPMADMACGAVDAATEAEIRNVVLYGKPVVTDQDEPRLFNWDEATIAVTVDCPAKGVYSGIYADGDEAPRVTVSVGTDGEEFVYEPLLGYLGLPVALKLNAQSTGPLIGM